MIDDPILRALVARINSCGSISKEDPSEFKNRKRSQVDRWLDQFDKLPKTVQMKLLKRLLPYKIMKCAFGWEITSPTGDVYLVTHEMRCSCPDNVYRGHKCKHIILVEENL